MRKLLVTSAFLLSAFTPIQPSGIYGADDRRDIYEVQDKQIQELADSTAAMFPNDSIRNYGDGSIAIKTEIIGEKYNFCPGERFADQPTGPDCSATLIGPDLLLTAGHCMGPRDCGDYTFVFGYQMKSKDEFAEEYAAKDVYRCKQVLSWNDSETVDYSLVRLDRKVEGRKPIELANQDIAKGENVFVIGYPSGLPAKYADNAKVKFQNYGYFVANLDAFAGNSGSAVFSSTSKKIVGVLVRGGTDYKTDKQRQCKVAYRCADEGCYGEEVTNISFVKKRLIY